ncbi:MAG TPA: hypothetical protein VKT72_11370 [Candidatus Baltobacteraceae bacterium]|nr:hypothetical protein [Candidatus Baltobacteraceae bacterium]
MANKKFVLLGFLLFAAMALFARPASAAPLCPTGESFFGSIVRVSGNMLTVRTASSHWADVRIESDARINTNGTSMRPGMYVGAYGCVEPGGVFSASEITLSTDQAAYREHLTGTVRRIETGKLLVAETGYGYGQWYVPDIDDFHVGQSVSATGMRGANGAFYPQTINGRTVAYDTDYASAPRSSITLNGTVRRVNGNSIIVWEPSDHTTGTWIVRNPSRFRVGERVSATGTENGHGDFYVQEITII